MTDYVIQKATAEKYGVVPSPDNIFGCRKAILEKLGGDSTNADTIYECDKRILPLLAKITEMENGNIKRNKEKLQVLCVFDFRICYVVDWLFTRTKRADTLICINGGWNDIDYCGRCDRHRFG